MRMLRFLAPFLLAALTSACAGGETRSGSDASSSSSSSSSSSGSGGADAGPAVEPCPPPVNWGLLGGATPLGPIESPRSLFVHGCTAFVSTLPSPEYGEL